MPHDLTARFYLLHYLFQSIHLVPFDIVRCLNRNRWLVAWSAPNRLVAPREFGMLISDLTATMVARKPASKKWQKKMNKSLLLDVL